MHLMRPTNKETIPELIIVGGTDGEVAEETETVASPPSKIM